MFAMGVFCGVIWGDMRGMRRVSACVWCEMVIFVGFGLVLEWEIRTNLPLEQQVDGKKCF